MHEDEEVTLNVKAIGLAVGGAALAALLFVLARRDDEPAPAAKVEAAVDEAKAETKKAAKAAKKRQKSLAKALAKRKEDVAAGVEDAAASLATDARAAERELKAAAWDAQQEARAAESRLRATGSRVVDDAAHLASRVGHEARSLAGEGRERIAHLRHRDGAPEEGELERLREEVESLRSQLAATGRKRERDYSALVSKLTSKSGPIPEEAISAALAQLERSLKAKGPALLAARDKKQVLDILQAELGPALRDSMIQAAAAALGILDSTRERAAETGLTVSETAQETARGIRATGREARERASHDVQDVERAVVEAIDAAKANGKRHQWFSHERGEDVAATQQTTPEAIEEEALHPAHRSKAGLFWGGAGLGLALYALLDAERREQVLRLTNEASIQVQELVRDLQGYDDEFS